jgi:hypothetical protein
MSGDRVERVLRERGPRELEGSVPPPPADVEEARFRLRMIDRRRGLRSLLGAGLGTVVVAAAAVAVAVAVTGPSGSANLGSGDLPGGASPSATAGPLVACGPGELRATAAPWGAAAGSRGTTVTVTNVGAATCLLEADRPGAQIRSASATIASAAAQPGSGTGLMAVGPSESLTTSVVWSNWCGAAPSGSLSLRLVLANGSELAVMPDPSAPGVLVPPCMGPSGVNVLSTIDFERP